MEMNEDHVHPFLNALPSFGSADIMEKIKGVTSKIIRDEFSELKVTPKEMCRAKRLNDMLNLNRQGADSHASNDYG